MTGHEQAMIWVVTAPHPVPDELSILRDLFSAGLETLLLRKPGWSAAEYETLLQALPPGYRNRVMLSGYPQLVERYGLKGLHLSERLRSEVPGLAALRGAGFCVSTSVHSAGGDGGVNTSRHITGLDCTRKGVNTLLRVADADRTAKGVNTSPHIAGGGYAEKGVNTLPHPEDTRRDNSGQTTPINPADWDFLLLGPAFDSISKAGYKGRSFSDIPPNAIAIGGVTPFNIEKLKELGFCGAAMLGAIWQEPAQAVEVFIKAKTLWK